MERKKLDSIAFFDLSPAGVLEEMRRNLSTALGYDVTEADPAFIVGAALLPMIMQGRAINDAALKAQLPSMATGAALDRLGERFGLERHREAAPGSFVVCIDSAPNDSGPRVVQITAGEIEAVFSGKKYSIVPGFYPFYKWSDADDFAWVEVVPAEAGPLDNTEYYVNKLETGEGDILKGFTRAYIGRIGAGIEDDETFSARIGEYIKAQNKQFSRDWWTWYGRTRDAGLTHTFDLFGGALYNFIAGPDETQPATVAVLSDAVRYVNNSPNVKINDYIWALINIDLSRWVIHFLNKFPIPQKFDVVFVLSRGPMASWPDGFSRERWQNGGNEYTTEIILKKGDLSADEARKINTKLNRAYMQLIYERSTAAGALPITAADISEALSGYGVDIVDVQVTPAPWIQTDPPGSDNAGIEYIVNLIESQQAFYISQFSFPVINWAM